MNQSSDKPLREDLSEAQKAQRKKLTDELIARHPTLTLETLVKIRKLAIASVEREKAKNK